MLKFIFASVVTVSLALFLAGCSGQNNSGSSNDGGERSSSVSDDSTPAGDPETGSVNEQVAKQSLKPVREFEEKIRPLLERYCIECHAPGEMEEFDFLVAETESDVVRLPEVYASVLEQMESLNMPPEDFDQLSDDDRKLVIDWIRKTVPAPDGKN